MYVYTLLNMRECAAFYVCRTNENLHTAYDDGCVDTFVEPKTLMIRAHHPHFHCFFNSPILVFIDMVIISSFCYYYPVLVLVCLLHSCVYTFDLWKTWRHAAAALSFALKEFYHARMFMHFAYINLLASSFAASVKYESSHSERWSLTEIVWGRLMLW